MLFREQNDTLARAPGRNSLLRQNPGMRNSPHGPNSFAREQEKLWRVQFRVTMELAIDRPETIRDRVSAELQRCSQLSWNRRLRNVVDQNVRSAHWRAVGAK